MQSLKIKINQQIFNINKKTKIEIIKEKKDFLQKKTNLLNKNIKILSSLSNLPENDNNITKKFTNEFVNIFDNNNNFNDENENFTCNSYKESNNILPLKYNTKENYKLQKNNDFYDNFFNNNYLEIDKNSDSFSLYENETLSTKKHIFISNNNNEFDFFNCKHENCEQKFKTLKQKINHHFKMNPECKKDVINILNNICKLKNIIYNLINKKGFVLNNDLIFKFNNIFNNILHKEYAQNILGLNFYQNFNNNNNNNNQI